jgi:alkylated DNA repair dioxygenase AlkB
LRKKEEKGFVDVQTRHGQLLVMEGDFQKEYTHEIPVQKKVKIPRLSLTARYHSK